MTLTLPDDLAERFPLLLGIGMGFVILSWHSLSLLYNYFANVNE